MGGASAAVVEQVVADFDAHLDRLLRYMRQPSVSATGEGIDAMCAMLAEDARELGGTAEIAPGSEFPVVLCRFDAGAPRTLVVHLMYDVAPAEEPEWVVEPFSATRMPWRGLGDCIVGRGAEDTKSEIAMIYNVIATYRAAGRPLPVNVLLVQEASELGSGSIEEVVRQRRDLFRAADVAWWPFISGRPDGTPVVYLGAKGLVTGKLRCRGGAWGGPVETSVHSMHANWIANPAEVLVQALAAMRRDGDVAIPGFYGDHPGPAPEELALIDRLVDQVSEAELLGELGVERFAQDDLREALYAYCFRSELNISGLSAGVTLERAHKCVIPTEAVASVDMRPVGQSLEDMYAAIDAFLAERFPAVSWEPLNGYVGDRVPLDSWPVQRMLQVYADMGTTPQVWPCMAAAIAVGLWTRDVGIPWIAGMPGHAAGKHAANEHIVVDGFRQACEFGVRLVAKLGADA